MKHTREELEQQRDELISEFNYHKVLHFCECIFEFFKYPAYDINTVKELREDATRAINSFIESHTNEGCQRLVSSTGWEVELTKILDGKNELLQLSYKYEVSEVLPYTYADKFEDGQ